MGLWPAQGHMAGVVPVLRPELGCMYAVRTSQHRQEGVGCATLKPVVCSPEAVLWSGTGEPEFQVLLRISTSDLLRSGKEDLDGISLQWGFCLSEGCRTGPAASGMCCVIPAHSTAVTSPHLCPFAPGVNTIRKSLRRKRDYIFYSLVRIYI